jgi:hypothetical protein
MNIITRIITTLLVLGICFSVWDIHADANSIKSFKLKGFIGDHFYLALDNLDEPDAYVIFDEVTEADYDNGFIDTADAIQISKIRSNSPVWLKISNKGWTLPAAYDSNGPKQTDGSDSELLLRVNSDSITTKRGFMRASGAFATGFTAVSNNAASVLQIGEVTKDGARKGVVNGSVDLDARVLLDQLYDAPGEYSVDLELTIGAQ